MATNTRASVLFESSRSRPSACRCVSSPMADFPPMEAEWAWTLREVAHRPTDAAAGGGPRAGALEEYRRARVRRHALLASADGGGGKRTRCPSAASPGPLAPLSPVFKDHHG